MCVFVFVCSCRCEVCGGICVLTSVYSVVCLQLVFEAEPLSTAVTLVRLLPGVDSLVAPQRAVIAETAPTELTLKRVVT